METSLGTLADLAEILGAAVVVGGVAFAVIQIRMFRRQRLEVASIELIRSFQSAEFGRAYTRLLPLREGAAAAELRQLGGDAEELAMLLSTRFETVGVMVYRRIVPIAIAEELMGGSIVSFWKKLEAWIRSVREEQGRADTHEWFQWLAEQLERRAAAAPAEPAYVAHREWRA